MSADSPSLRRDIGKADPSLSGTIDRIALRRAMEELPDGCRQIFALHEVEGYQHHEIAEMLDCSVGNSKSQLHKAKMKMRDLLFPKRRVRRPHSEPWQRIESCQHQQRSASTPAGLWQVGEKSEWTKTAIARDAVANEHWYSLYAQGFTVLRAGDRGSYGDMGKHRNTRTRQNGDRVKGKRVTTRGTS